jgi:hypothetical protein
MWQSIRIDTLQLWSVIFEVKIIFCTVSEHTESIDFPLHEAARRGNLTFLKECIDNQVLYLMWRFKHSNITNSGIGKLFG